MASRIIIAPLVLAGAAVGFGQAPPPAPAGPTGATARPPNLVIILADDLGYGDVGAYGGGRIATPNIDTLARQGIRLTDGHVAAAVCSPSRAALLTGRYPQRFGYDFNDNARPGLPLTETTIASRLQAAGYATGIVGKWQLGWKAEQRPQRRGFDEFFGMASGGIYIDPATPGVETWIPGGGTLPPGWGHDRFRGDEPVKDDTYLTDALTREATAFIRRHKDEPFFLYLAHYAPHVPLQATAPYLDRYRDIADTPTRIYDAMVSALDDGIGAVTATLRELGLEDNTLVVFLSDNGCALYLGGACCNDPLSGGKRYQLEGGIRVPFLVRWPARLAAGELYGHTVSSLDVAPTLLAAAMGPDKIPEGLDGVNLLPYLSGERAGPPHERLFWRAGPNRAVREGYWKLWQVNRASPEEAAAVAGPGALLRDWRAPADSPNGRLTLLYDLAADVGEHHDLAERYPDVVRSLLATMDAWNAGMAAPTIASSRGTVADIDGVPVELIF